MGARAHFEAEKNKKRCEAWHVGARAHFEAARFDSLPEWCGKCDPSVDSNRFIRAAEELQAVCTAAAYYHRVIIRD